MKKLFKAAASLTVGCALLSTSAFAALINPSVVESEETAGVYTASVTKEGATSWESTILVLKANSVETVDGETKIKSSVNDEDIYYINQTSAESATATYSIAETTEKLYVFAGGSGEDAALYLGSIDANIPATNVVISGDGVTTNESNVKVAALTVEDKLQLNADVAPETATDKTVTWTSSSDEIATVVDGLVTAKAAGTVTITATANNGTEQAKDAVNITISEAASEPDDIFFTSEDTDKATVSSFRNSTSVGADWAFAGYSEEVVVYLKAYENVADTTNGYTLKVVSSDEKPIDTAKVYYSAETERFIVLIPEGVANYKFQLVPGGMQNEVLALYGDVTAPKSLGVTTADRTALNKVLTGATKLDELQKLRTDVTGDGKITTADRTALNKRLTPSATTLRIIDLLVKIK